MIGKAVKMSALDNLVTFFNRDKLIGPGAGEKQTFAARCHCGNIQFTVTLPISTLPMNAYICSCTMCRYSHGTFGSFHVTLPQGVAPEWTNNAINVAIYRTPGSEPGDRRQRWFCPICGAHNGHYEPWAAQWVADISLFDEPIFWTIKGIVFTKSPGDGGLLPWFGRKLIQVSQDTDFAPDYKVDVGEDGEERLRAECMCGGVSFKIRRPFDLVKQDEFMNRYVAPGEPDKWKAFLDFDPETRRLSSAHFMPWALVPRIALEPEVLPDLLIGTMKTYKVSDKITTSFCGRCGATVFLRNRDRMPSEQNEVLNVAMGILRAPEGAKAMNWVKWQDGSALRKNLPKYDSDFNDDVAETQKKWVLETYKEEPDANIL